MSTGMNTGNMSDYHYKVVELQRENDRLRTRLCELEGQEPVAYAVFAENGNIRIWSADPIQVETLRQEYGDQVQSLYAAHQPAPDVTALVEALEEIRSRSSINFVMRLDSFGLTAELGNMHQIADSALSAHRKQGGE